MLKLTGRKTFFATPVWCFYNCSPRRQLRWSPLLHRPIQLRRACKMQNKRQMFSFPLSCSLNSQNAFQFRALHPVTFINTATPSLSPRHLPVDVSVELWLVAGSKWFCNWMLRESARVCACTQERQMSGVCQRTAVPCHSWSLAKHLRPIWAGGQK